MFNLFKEILTTLLTGALIGGGVILGSVYLHLPVPAPHQRPVFFIGVVLFAVCFRLVMMVKEEN